MIDAIIEWSARNKFVVLLVTGIGIAMGVYSIRHIPLDAIPDLSDPGIAETFCKSSGASPQRCTPD